MRKKLIPLMLCLIGGSAAAEELPLLRVHPGLLGPRPAEPAPAPAEPVAALPKVEPAPPAPVVTAPPPAPVPAAPAPIVRQKAAPPAPPLAASAAPAAVAPAPVPTPAPMPTPARIAAPGPRPGAAPSAGQPVNIVADSITGRTENEIHAEGHVQLVKSDMTLAADQLTYRQVEDEVEAQGAVSLTRGKSEVSGPYAKLRFDEQTGYFDHPQYRFERTPRPGVPRASSVGSGAAERIDFEGENHYRLLNATFSTCRASDPDWYAQASDLRLDYDNERAEGKSAKVVFKGVPIVYAPWLDFSLNDKRKSGLLAPTLGGSNRTGFDYTQPVYWDIAPNLDATFSPRVITRRGVQLGTEFRYLERDFQGEIRGEYMANDRETQTTRDALFLRHRHNFGGGVTGSLDFNSVSDARYFTDLSSRLAMTSQSYLLRQAQLGWGGGWWGLTATAQHYQTLQDPSQPALDVPYDRVPQVLLNASRPDVLGGMSFAWHSEFVDFSHPTRDQGQRLVLYPQFAWPLQTAALTLTPKIGVHHTEYALDRRATSGAGSITRTLPIFSLDGAVTFERDATLLGRDITQTLEPRLYYVRIPRRDQSAIPVFDSAQTDFNFAQMFSENIFSGADRIADSNQLTAALTSRAIDPANGAEWLRGALGQRFYFADQTVTLPGVAPRSGRKADVLAALTGRVSRAVALDAGWQYNPRDSHTERYNLGTRYTPGPNQVLNLSYRYTRDVPALGLTGVRDLDVSTQWPLGRGWYGVARYDYSLRDNRIVEALGGLEYDGGCWALRLVAHRLATATDANNTALFVQLELNGFSRIGSSPFDLLKRSIGGYGMINQSAADPIFGLQ